MNTNIPHIPRAPYNNRDNNLFQTTDLLTPAFIYDEGNLTSSGNYLASLAKKANCKILLSLKPFITEDYLQLMSQFVDGFSVGSMFDAKLAYEIAGKGQTVHITTPGLKPDEIKCIAENCDYIAFNSLSQWDRLGEFVKDKSNCGLRINPNISNVKDERYNPCRKHSKLGVPIEKLIEALNREPDFFSGIKGLHFHTNCDASDFSPLLKTVQQIDSKLESFLRKIQWINMGGGYLFKEAKNIDPFYDVVNLLKSKYELEVFIEPGASFVRDSGYIVSSVIDIFENEGKTIAILDTSINHMPEVFEYQFEPDVVDHIDDGEHSYILAGNTCLAGDIFGEYSFREPLEIGDKVVFKNMGAYTLVKAHMFNGVNLPTIYSYTSDKKLEQKKQFDYYDYKSRVGVNNYGTEGKRSLYSKS